MPKWFEFELLGWSCEVLVSDDAYILGVAGGLLLLLQRIAAHIEHHTPSQLNKTIKNHSNYLCFMSSRPR